jgi:hypothetical protein
MFIKDADLSCLRQGDIVHGIPFPRLDGREIRYLGSSTGEPSMLVPSLSACTSVHNDDPNWLTAQVPVRLSFCALISQCCDLELRHSNGKLAVPAFALARLRSIGSKTLADPQRLESLRENRDPRSGDPAFINMFYVPLHDLLHGREWVIDFNQLVSVPATEYQSTLRKKLLQMEDQSRVRFKIRLAFSLSRFTDDERMAGLDKES